jgi:hypothetical protein
VREPAYHYAPGRHVAEAAREDVIERAQSPDQIELLEDKPNLAAGQGQLTTIERLHGIIAEENLAVIGQGEARKTSKKRSFPSTTRAEYRDHLTRRDIEGHIVEDNVVAEPLLEPDDADRWFAGHRQIDHTSFHRSQALN